MRRSQIDRYTIEFIDEIDKMSVKDQSFLVNIMEKGKLQRHNIERLEPQI